MSDISDPESKIISLIYTRSGARSGRTELLAQQVQTGISDRARTDIWHGTMQALSSVRFKSSLQVCSMKCVLWIAACLNFVCICSVHTLLSTHFAFMIVKHWKMQQSSGTLSHTRNTFLTEAGQMKTDVWGFARRAGRETWHIFPFGGGCCHETLMKAGPSNDEWPV